MKFFNGILRDKRKSTDKILRMNDWDDPVMFLDKSHLGSRQLRYFISKRARNEMKKFSYDYFGVETTGWHIGSIPNTRTIVKDCTICNPRVISHIKYIITGGDHQHKAVNVMCFDFQ